MQKNEIRAQIKALKKQLDEQTKAETASAVFALLESCPEFQKARTVLAYHALPDELPTQAFLQQWSNGKKLYLPRVNGDELDILPYSPESLHKGAFSILEPDGNECTDVDTLGVLRPTASKGQMSENRHCLPFSTAGRNTGRAPRHPDGQNNYRTGHPINQ